MKICKKKKLVENQMEKLKGMVPVLCYGIHGLQKHGGA